VTDFIFPVRVRRSVCRNALTAFLERYLQRRQIVAVVVSAVLLVAGCSAKNKRAIPNNVTQPDRYLVDRGNEALMKKKWMDAREYFRQVVDNYPQSPLRPDAKLGVGDAYLGEHTTESLVLAANEFREFLTFYPTNPRADYAQYKLAMSHYEQMRAPERDQTETRDALKEFDAFFARFPQSQLAPEVKQKWRESRDRLSQASYRVGLHYFRVKWYPGAIDRFREVLRDDPGFTNRDLVYFYIAESLARTNKTAEAIPYFERLIAEFTMSERLDEAKKRLEELKVAQAAPPKDSKTQ
jgi:outer membrane protein assembly factor BamD